MLHEFGKIAIAEIVFYAPVLCFAFFTVFRHGLSRREGWIYLVTFSFIRILGALLSIISKTESNPSIGILIAVAILQASGLSPLLLSTLGFVNNIVDHTLPFLTRVLRIIRLVFMAGVVLAIIAGTKLSPDNPPSSQATGHALSKAGSVCFASGYVALLVLEVQLWGSRENASQNHRKLLFSLLCALPFLAVRVVYSMLGAFASSPPQWSPTVGNWRLYLTMDLIMEYIVVCIYIITGITMPFDKDESGYKRRLVPIMLVDGSLEMGNQRHTPLH